MPYKILAPVKDRKKEYRFTAPVAHLLALVSDQERRVILETKIYCRSLIRYIPWFRTSKGGGAITFANRRWRSITYTENFFSNDLSRFGEKAYGNDTMAWLHLSAHEVGHIKHGFKYGSLLIYLIAFIFQYIRFGHGAAPLEIEADQGSNTLMRWHNYLKINSLGDIVSLLQSDQQDEVIIAVLDTWWEAFQCDLNSQA
ncbi:MAG: hypothetical protein HKN09_01275 [Saprospiraceae bacterium]|nr:hypothetical protein [Saprospiraceae bacterium]